MNVQSIVDQHAAQLNIGKFTISELGQGENHTNYLIDDGKLKIVLRLNTRPDEAQRLIDEMNILKQLPEDIGPRLILAKKDYAFISYIPGEVVDSWDDKKIKKFSEVLARLHKTTETSKRCVLITQFDEWYAEQKVKKYPKLYEEIRSSFNKIESQSCLVHGDTCCDNIIISDTARLIDWESSHIGDPAEDIARIYYPLHHLHPWFCAITDKQIELLINHYQTIRPDPNLHERVKQWNTALMFLDLHYYQYALTTEKDKEKIVRYTDGINILEGIFKQQFGTSE